MRSRSSRGVKDGVNLAEVDEVASNTDGHVLLCTVVGIIASPGDVVSISGWKKFPSDNTFKKGEEGDQTCVFASEAWLSFEEVNQC